MELQLHALPRPTLSALLLKPQSTTSAQVCPRALRLLPTLRRSPLATQP
jgi:hypothetical protein